MKKIEMTVEKALRSIMTELGVSQAKLAGKMGIKNQQTVYNMITSKTGMRANNMIKMFEALGYEVVIRNKVNDAEIVLEASDAEDGR